MPAVLSSNVISLNVSVISKLGYTEGNHYNLMFKPGHMFRVKGDVKHSLNSIIFETYIDQSCLLLHW